jgi:hypothetical protein
MALKLLALTLNVLKGAFKASKGQPRPFAARMTVTMASTMSLIW